jgi:hypothetical protein
VANDVIGSLLGGDSPGTRTLALGPAIYGLCAVAHGLHGTSGHARWNVDCAAREETSAKCATRVFAKVCCAAFAAPIDLAALGRRRFQVLQKSAAQLLPRRSISLRSVVVA